MLHRVLNKETQYRLAAQAGIPTPRTYVLHSADEIGEAIRSLGLPCLVKPVFSHRWVRAFQDGTKLMMVRSHEDALRVFSKVVAKGLEVLLQEWIPGPDDHIYSIHLYMDKRGQILGLGTDRKLRQYLPRTGNGTLRVTTSNSAVTDLGIRTVEALEFSGLGNVEFRLDPRDGQFKLMELNGRATSALTITSASGVDLPWIAYCDAIDRPIRAADVCKARVKWWYFEGDYMSYRIYRRRRELTLFEWVKSVWGATSFAWFSRDDLKPFFKATRRFVWRLRHRSTDALEEESITRRVSVLNPKSYSE